MAAYLIAEVDVTDPQAYAEYAKGTPDAIARHGGRFVVRGGKASPKEGEWGGRLVVIEFPDMAAAEAFYASAEYTPLLKIRKAASNSRLVLVEGV